MAQKYICLKKKTIQILHHDMTSGTVIAWLERLSALVAVGFLRNFFECDHLVSERTLKQEVKPRCT